MNASQLNDMFGDSSSDNETPNEVPSSSSSKNNNTPACFGAIYQATRIFVAQHETIVDDLVNNDTIPAHLSKALLQAIPLFKAYANDSTSNGTTANTMNSVCELSGTCADAAWKLLHEQKAWPHPCWRELFIVSSLMKACALLANSELLQALQCTDRAFMLGAPKQITNLVFRLVDPLVVVLAETQHEHSGARLPGLNGVVMPQSEAEWKALVERLSPHVQLEQVQRKSGSAMGDPRQEKEPLLLDGCTEGWKANTRWLELAFWERRGYRVVPVELGKGFMGDESAVNVINDDSNGSISAGETDSSSSSGGGVTKSKEMIKEQAMLLGDFVRDYVAPWCSESVCASASALLTGSSSSTITAVDIDGGNVATASIDKGLQQVSLSDQADNSSNSSNNTLKQHTDVNAQTKKSIGRGAYADDNSDNRSGDGSSGSVSSSGSESDEEDDVDEDARQAALEAARSGRKRANRKVLKVMRETDQLFDGQPHTESVSVAAVAPAVVVVVDGHSQQTEAGANADDVTDGLIANDTFSNNNQVTESRHVAYLAQHNLMDQIPQLRTDFTQPKCSVHNGYKLANSSIWFGTAHTVTLLHYDSYDNFLVQVAGFKYVVLFPTSQTANLKTGEQASKKGSTSSYCAQGNTCSVNVAEPNLQEHRLYSNAKGWAVLLRPGDTLYIPKGCWHYVRSLTASLSVNFWIEKDDE